MEETYNFTEVEPRVRGLWKQGEYFAAKKDAPARPYAMFLNPPNASGPMHVGNALMIAIQDVVARYQRARGASTLWIPSIDHGGYETQVTYERETNTSIATDARSRKEVYAAISAFVARNNQKINEQVEAMGASVDWSRYRYTLDDAALTFVSSMFKKMMEDKLIYRSSYMMNYCPSCATVLADIELRETQTTAPLYHIKFPFKDVEGSLSLATTRPEFLFAVTHVLAHPRDARLAQYIGKQLVNPATGEAVAIVESKRRFDPDAVNPYLFAFSPSHSKYDFEYAIRNGLPTRNLLDWEGTMIERYPGMAPEQARHAEVELLTKQGAIERVDEAYTDVGHLCKKGHVVETVLRMSWFLRLDDAKVPLRQPALDAVARERLSVFPFWRKKGLVEWIGKMHDWPIGRQNVWGIKMPIWYEITDPSLFTVWFVDKGGASQHGTLQAFLDAGITLEEVAEGLERIYAAEGAVWTLEKEAGKSYLPETDTFDTWFSSGAWGTMVFDDAASPGISKYYPSEVLVIGYDLLRLAVSREIILGVYLRGRLPFRHVYFHALVKSADGQKMSKSLGNAVTLDTYLEQYGADVTRMALVSYIGSAEDFSIAPERLEFFVTFAKRLWAIGALCCTAERGTVGSYLPEQLTADDARLLSEVLALGKSTDQDVERYQLAGAQERLVSFLERLEVFSASIAERGDAQQAVAILNRAVKAYVTFLHPFMPFMTEELFTKVYGASAPLASLVRSPSRR